MGLIKAGVCLYLPDVGNRKTRLHVVLNDPFGDPPTVAIVSLSSTIDGDKTTILNVGDHDYITKETYVVYPWMKAKNAAKLEAEVAADMSMRHHHNCSPELLKRIQDGIFKSPHMRPKALKYCEYALGRKKIKQAIDPSNPKSDS